MHVMRFLCLPVSLLFIDYLLIAAKINIAIF